MIKSTDEDEEAITGLLDTDAKTNSESNGSSGASDSNNEGHTSNHNIVDIPLCGILSVKFYKPYFDVDTKDITNRLYHALVSFKVNFFHFFLYTFHFTSLHFISYDIIVTL